MDSINEYVFKKFPVLKTRNLTLRKISLNDTNNVFSIFANPETVRYFGKHPFTELSQAKERIIQSITAFRNKEGIRWAITLNTSNELIGSAGIWRIERSHFRGELGYELSPDYWGKGIMKEALSEIVKFGFEQIKIHSIEANTDPENIASRKLLESLGFKQEGLLRESFYFDGKFYDNVIYSLVNFNHSNK